MGGPGSGRKKINNIRKLVYLPKKLWDKIEKKAKKKKVNRSKMVEIICKYHLED